MTGRHGWNSWDQYESTHARHMRHFDGFVIEDNLSVEPGRTLVVWGGQLRCVDGFELAVTKRQEVRLDRGRPSVRTVRYSYQGLRRLGGKTIELFRYDNYHVHPGHPDAHHKHSCDAAGNEIYPPDHVGENGSPTLSDALEELRSHWLDWLNSSG
jgi:Family of unknown function (DUF6516)